MFALEGRRPTSPPCSRTTGSVAPHHEGNSFRAFALNAPFRAVTIIGLANVSSRVLEYLSANPGLFLWMRVVPSAAVLIRRPLMFQASLRSPRRRFTSARSAAHSRERSFQRRSSARRVTIILNSPANQGIQSGFLRKCPRPFPRPILSSSLSYLPIFSRFLSVSSPFSDCFDLPSFTYSLTLILPFGLSSVPTGRFACFNLHYRLPVWFC